MCKLFLKPEGENVKYGFPVPNIENFFKSVIMTDTVQTDIPDLVFNVYAIGLTNPSEFDIEYAKILILSSISDPNKVAIIKRPFRVSREGNKIKIDIRLAITDKV